MGRGFETHFDAGGGFRYGAGLQFSTLSQSKVLLWAGRWCPRQRGQERDGGSGKKEWNGQCRWTVSPSHAWSTFMREIIPFGRVGCPIQKPFSPSELVGSVSRLLA